MLVRRAHRRSRRPRSGRDRRRHRSRTHPAGSPTCRRNWQVASSTAPGRPSARTRGPHIFRRFVGACVASTSKGDRSAASDAGGGSTRTGRRDADRPGRLGGDGDPRPPRRGRQARHRVGGRVPDRRRARGGRDDVRDVAVVAARAQRRQPNQGPVRHRQRRGARVHGDDRQPARAPGDDHPGAGGRVRTAVGAPPGRQHRAGDGPRRLPAEPGPQVPGRRPSATSCRHPGRRRSTGRPITGGSPCRTRSALPCGRQVRPAPDPLRRRFARASLAACRHPLRRPGAATRPGRGSTTA